MNTLYKILGTILLSVLIIIIIILLLVTGGFKKIKSGITQDKAFDTLGELSISPHSKTTEGAMRDATKDLKKAESLSSIPIIGNMLADNYTARASKKLEFASKTDKVYLKYKSEQNKESENKVVSSLQKLIPIFVVIFIVLILLVILKVKAVKRPRTDALIVESTETELYSDIDDVDASNVKRTGQLKVDYEKLLRKACDEKGLDYDDTLKEYSDARTAYETVQFR